MRPALLRLPVLNVRRGAALHLGCTLWQADKSLLAKLRRKTGFSISNCKKALELHDNDADKAESWLRAQAQAQGWEKATKLSGRRTAQGLVGIHIEGHSGVMVEVNCETDFVARNEKFTTLVSQVTKDFFQQAATATPHPQGVVKESFSEEQLRAVPAGEGKTLGDKLALAIGTIGENMSLPRATRVTVDQDTQLVGYCHPSTVDQDMPRGRYGSILALRTHRPLTEVAKQLCAHVIGMNPKAIGEEGDPKAENPDDETLLVHQEFLSDPSLTVGEVLREEGLQVVDFVRYEAGETQEREE